MAHHGWTSGTRYRCNLDGTPLLDSGTTPGVLIMRMTSSNSISAWSLWLYVKVTSRQPGIGTGCIFWISSLTPEAVTFAGNTCSSLVHMICLFFFRLSLVNTLTGGGIGGLPEGAATAGTAGTRGAATGGGTGGAATGGGARGSYSWWRCGATTSGGSCRWFLHHFHGL